MSLVVCPECGREKVSDKAPVCPECGFPIAEYFSKNHAQTEGAPSEACGVPEEEKRAQPGIEAGDMKGTIRACCEAFLEQIGTEADSFTFTDKLRKGLRLPEDADVYLAHDDTFFKNGKNGFAITDRGFYCKELAGSTNFTSWDDLAKYPEVFWTSEDFPTLELPDDEKALVYYTDGDEDVQEALLFLLSEIVRTVSRENPVPAGETISAGPAVSGAASDSAALPTRLAESPEQDAAGQPEQDPARQPEQDAAGQPEQSTAERPQKRKGFFDFSGGGNMGFASVENTRNFTDQDLHDLLSEVKTSFGLPVMGDINGTPAVMYKKVTPLTDIFCRVHGKKVIMGTIGTDGVSSLETARNVRSNILLEFNDEDTSRANRAVDELLSVVRRLEDGETVRESGAPDPADATALFMKQKAISLKPKFDIFDQNEEMVYHVEGDLARLNFSIQRHGEEVLKLKKKLVAIMPEYIVLQDNREIARIKKKFRLTNPELSGQVNGQPLAISGDLFGYDFDILAGGKVIGHVDTDRSFWSDCYRIRSYDPNLQDFVIALAIICDNVSDQDDD